MVNWTDPKDWIPGEKLLSEDFNTYLRDNLLYLRYRNVYQTRVGILATDQTTASGDGWKPVLPNDLVVDFTCWGGDIEITAYVNIMNSVDDAEVYFDFFLEPDDGSTGYFLSSRTITPTTEGVHSMQRKANDRMTVGVYYYLPQLLAGGYKLTVWHGASTGNNIVHSSAMPTWMILEETGKAEHSAEELWL